MDNYNPMHLSTPNTPNKNIHIYQNPTRRIWFFFEKKISKSEAFLEQKVVDKRLGKFVVIFIYLKEINFGKKTLIGNRLIVQKIAKMSALNRFVNMIWGRGLAQWWVISYIKQLHFFKFFFLCSFWTYCILPF